MKKVLVVFGTRPEAVKMAPVVKAIEASPTLQGIVCVTGQHRQMLDQILDLFGIEPDRDLDIMKPNQTLSSLTAHVLEQLNAVISEVNPDIILVQGDTTTVMAAGLAAYYAKVPVGHVEAGLRTHQKYSPFPEEMNRQVTSVLATYHFAPTKLARENLIRENIGAENIFITGNTVVDALLDVLKKIDKDGFKKEIERRFDFLDDKRRVVLITGHRRESFGEAFRSICHGFRELAEKFTDIDFIYPVHLNPNVQGPVKDILGREKLSNFHLMDPLDYLPFVYLMSRSCLIITDSGGIQEEAPSLGKPVLVTRHVTERPEGLETGLIHLVGNRREKIVSEGTRLLSLDNDVHTDRKKVLNPYGDGRAAARIVEILQDVL